MTCYDRTWFCCSSLNCRNFRDFLGGIKSSIAGCYNSTKKGDICKYFSCLTNRDFFVDLEKGSANNNNNNNNNNCRGKVFNKEPDIENGEAICVNCGVKKADVVIIPCGHSTFCDDCLEEWSENNGNCPTCGVVMTDVVQCI